MQRLGPLNFGFLKTIVANNFLNISWGLEKKGVNPIVTNRGLTGYAYKVPTSRHKASGESTWIKGPLEVFCPATFIGTNRQWDRGLIQAATCPTTWWMMGRISLLLFSSEHAISGPVWPHGTPTHTQLTPCQNVLLFWCGLVCPSLVHSQHTRSLGTG